mmetsp:Transcript_8872/g.14409  ORF Transcript_8872/g.14409 Transcript_8872/m.14409 type:complete len:98 (-) Transcript_8872:447-740(-)
MISQVAGNMGVLHYAATTTVDASYDRLSCIGNCQIPESNFVSTCRMTNNTLPCLVVGVYNPLVTTFTVQQYSLEVKTSPSKLTSKPRQYTVSTHLGL